MVRKLSTTVVVLAAAVLIGCNTAESSAAGPGELAMASSNAPVRLGAGDELGENMFRHYAEVARSRRERLARTQNRQQVTDAESDNAQSWFVVLPHRKMVVYPGAVVLKPVNSQVSNVTSVHQLLPL